MAARVINNFETGQAKVNFVKSVLERRDEFKSEEDKLLLKRAELAIAKRQAYVKIPFTMGLATICALTLFNKKLSPVMRIAPIFFAMPTVVFYSKNVGDYAVQKRIDNVLILMSEQKQGEGDDCEVRQLTRQFLQERGFSNLKASYSLLERAFIRHSSN